MRDRDSVFCIVDEKDKHEAIDHIIAACSIFDELPDKKRFADAVHRRERVQSTGIGHGVAIAHGKCPGIEDPSIALGISPEGIIFDDRFPDPVHIIFVIASSPTKESLYLRAVASILSWVHDADFRAMLLSGEDCGDVTRFFNMLRTQAFVPRA